MPTDEWYHARMLELFAGKFGEELYVSVVIEAPQDQRDAVVCAYLGYYPDGEFRHVRTSPEALSLPAARQRIQTYQVDPRGPSQLHVYRVVLSAPPASQDELWMTMARSETEPLGLPMAFFSFMTTRGGEVVVFWHPPRVSTIWMLETFQRQLG